MKKNIKFLFILTMFLVLIINTYCFAINMNLTMNNQTGNNELEVQTNEVNAENNNSIDTSVQNSENNTEETYTPSNAPSVVTTTTSNSNNFLTIDNIISIILIAIGIVLILFGIAIFVRFK
ncbi:MAG: hypothetical protein V8R26_00185 [Clostridia bacterium]|nr:hypothetical protein [Clostridia bacterium]